ncbi:Glutathione S-transferase Y-2 [Pichia kudriavzevii]|uniref:Glutathione S-transferase Y-2 n=1 Tax=Pichia kudriavzevii TaxID=4909 RepID=A0A099NWP7_PICKU|nr:hypothetical protein JL09_g3836 [Pichia kudriavzevii]ONH72803.1 Glutathione S-transferase Y-2 [Pichia kudriavzevii]
MTFGTLYILPPSPRSAWLPKLAKYLALEINVKSMLEVEDFKSKFPLGKAPAFEGSDGFRLTETLAIIKYFIDSSSKPEFAGSSLKEKALNEKWLSFANSDLCGAMVGVWFCKDESKKPELVSKLNSLLQYIDNELNNSKFLVGDSVLVADILLYVTLQHIVEIGVDISSFSHLKKYSEEVAKHELLAE